MFFNAKAGGDFFPLGGRAWGAKIFYKDEKGGQNFLQKKKGGTIIFLVQACLEASAPLQANKWTVPYFSHKYSPVPNKRHSRINVMVGKFPKNK